MVVGRVGAEHFRRPGLEIRNHRVHRHAAAGDHDAGLAGGAKVGVDAAFAKGPVQRQRGIFLAERAIGADGEQPLAAALAPVADGDRRRRGADVDQPPPGPPGGLDERGNARQPGAGR